MAILRRTAAAEETALQALESPGAANSERRALPSAADAEETDVEKEVENIPF